MHKKRIHDHHLFLRIHHHYIFAAITYFVTEIFLSARSAASTCYDVETTASTRWTATIPWTGVSSGCETWMVYTSLLFSLHFGASGGGNDLLTGWKEGGMKKKRVDERSSLEHLHCTSHDGVFLFCQTLVSFMKTKQGAKNPQVQG